MQSGERREFMLGVVLVIMTFLSTSVAGPVITNRNGGPPDIPHPIDLCIFSCDLCFKAEALVHCANACIISEGLMDASWRRVCKMIEAPMIPHSSPNREKDTWFPSGTGLLQ